MNLQVFWNVTFFSDSVTMLSVTWDMASVTMCSDKVMVSMKTQDMETMSIPVSVIEGGANVTLPQNILCQVILIRLAYLEPGIH